MRTIVYELVHFNFQLICKAQDVHKIEIEIEKEYVLALMW